MARKAVHYIRGLDVHALALSLCGKLLYTQVRTHDGRGFIRHRLNHSERGDDVTCKACRGLLTMSPAERVSALAIEKNRKQVALDKLKSNKAEADRKKREVVVREIQAAQGDALICYDAWISDPPLAIKRCWQIMGLHNEQCNLSANHDGPHRMHVEGEPRHLDLDEVLAVALTRYSFEHPRSRGARLWVFRESTRDLPDPLTPYVREILLGDRRRQKSMSHRDVVCRFCDRVLGHRMAMGHDYSDYTFYPPGTTDTSKIDPVDTISVRNHTVTCALAYLADIRPTDDRVRVLECTDGLPSQSFVLDHDEVSP